MNLSGVVMLVLLVTGIFLAGGMLINDFEENYVQTNITDASPIDQSLNESLVSETDINETVDPLVKNIDDISTQEGFLDVVGDGTIVLPILFINFVLTIATFIGLTQQQTIAILEFIGIPVIIISFIVVAIVVWFVFKIVGQLRRYEP